MILSFKTVEIHVVLLPLVQSWSTGVSIIASFGNFPNSRQQKGLASATPPIAKSEF